MEKNLTTGSVGRQLIGFSLPYLLSYLLQTLYGMADLFIIGQYEGVAGTTAVAVGSQVMHMLTVMIVGLAMGTTVSIARAIGADDRPQAAAATGNTVTLFLSLSLVLTAGLLLLRRPDGCTMGPSMVGLEASSVNKLYDRLSKRTDYREAGVLRDTDFDARRLFQLYDPSNNVVEIYAYLRNVREEILMH